jgi:hypothetical protein
MSRNKVTSDTQKSKNTKESKVVSGSVEKKKRKKTVLPSKSKKTKTMSQMAQITEIITDNVNTVTLPQLYVIQNVSMSISPIPRQMVQNFFFFFFLQIMKNEIIFFI